MKNSLPAVPTISDLPQGSTVPVPRYNFLSWVLCGDVDSDAGDISLERKVDVGSDETDRQVTSVAQESMAAKAFIGYSISFFGSSAVCLLQQRVSCRS